MNGLICCALGFTMGLFAGYLADTVVSVYRRRRHEKELLQNMQQMKTGLLLMAHLNQKHRERMERMDRN